MEVESQQAFYKKVTRMSERAFPPAIASATAVNEVRSVFVFLNREVVI